MTVALGNPVDFILTGGEVSDITQAQALLKDKQATYLAADKGYDSNSFITKLKEREIQAVIPPRSNRLFQRDYDKHLYKDRNLIE